MQFPVSLKYGWVVCCLAMLCISASPAWSADRQPAYEVQPRWWWPLFGPKKKSPLEQFEYAYKLANRGKTRKAIKAYRKLTNFWPESIEAPRAQLELARLLEKRKKTEDAFEAYQVLVDKYAGEFNYEEVMSRQFAIARGTEQDRVGDVLLLPGFAAPERAIPMYQQIVANAPRWRKSAEAQFLIGFINEENRNYEKAILAYNETVSKYKDSAFAELAAFHKARCLYNIARENPNDDGAAEQAWASLTLYLNKYPQTERSEAAYDLLAHMRNRLAESFYQKAHYYDKITKKPKAALLAYQAFVEQFPDSEWTEISKSRIEALSRELDDSYEN